MPNRPRIAILSWLFAGGAGLYGILVLLNWAGIGMDVTAHATGTAKTSLATALCMLLASVAVLILSIFPAGDRRRALAARICIGAVLAFALYALVRYVILLPDAGYLLGSELGRMSPATAICMVLLGGAMLAILLGRYWIAALACVIGLIMCETAIVGYAFAVYARSEAFIFSAMSLPSAVSLTLLFIGTLLLEPEHSWARRLSSGSLSGPAFWLLMPVSVFGPVALASVVLRAVQVGSLEIAIGLGVMAVSLSVLLGTIVVATCFWLDRSERSSAMLAAIVQSSSDAIVSNSLDGCFTSWNPGAEGMFGYSREEALGQPMDIIIPPAHRAMGRASFEELCAGQDVPPFEAAAQRKDGSEFDVSITLSTLRLASGEVIGVSAIFHDITEAKRKDADLQRSNAELEQFAYIASHDLQEPLRMVANYVELLANRYQDVLDEKAHKYIHYASDGARRMQQLVTDLLAYSRVGSQGKVLERVDTGLVVERAVRSLSVPIETSGATFEIGTLPPVLGDEIQLGQLFQNLVGNALKFRAAAAPHITIDAEPEGRHWRFRVQDNGIGMDMQYAGRIFQMFQRMHARGSYDGSGIGLAIAKRIVERHGGRIWAESEPGHGSTFFFTLRAVASWGQMPASMPAAGSSTSGEIKNGRMAEAKN